MVKLECIEIKWHILKSDMITLDNLKTEIANALAKEKSIGTTKFM